MIDALKNRKHLLHHASINFVIMFFYQFRVIRHSNQPVHYRFISIAVVSELPCLHRQNIRQRVRIQYPIKDRRSVSLIYKFRRFDLYLLSADFYRVLRVSGAWLFFLLYFARRFRLVKCRRFRYFLLSLLCIRNYFLSYCHIFSPFSFNKDKKGGMNKNQIPPFLLLTHRLECHVPELAISAFGVDSRECHAVGRR
nr:MAG TPA: hypothetical protein [Caudoviricetes sp.]